MNEWMLCRKELEFALYSNNWLLSITLTNSSVRKVCICEDIPGNSWNNKYLIKLKWFTIQMAVPVIHMHVIYSF